MIKKTEKILGFFEVKYLNFRLSRDFNLFRHHPAVDLAQRLN